MFHKGSQPQIRKLFFQIAIVHFRSEPFPEYIDVHQIPDATASFIKMLCHMCHHINIKILCFKIIHIQKSLSPYRPGQIREIGVLSLIHRPVIHGPVCLHHDSRCFPVNIMMFDLLFQNISHAFQFCCCLLHEVSVDQNVDVTHFPQKRRGIIKFHPGALHGLARNLRFFHPLLQHFQFL